MRKKQVAANRSFSEESLVERIRSRAGIRYQSSQLAAYFGVPTARMTEVLKKLAALGQIRIVRCGGNPTMYYLPSEDELKTEARLAGQGAPPVAIVRGESANDVVRRQLGFGLVGKKL